MTIPLQKFVTPVKKHDGINDKRKLSSIVKDEFDLTKSGVFDCKPFIDKGGVFSKLSDPEFF
jgi:hypothetical protein